MHKCDCLNDCGDDPDLERGNVEPCKHMKERMRQKAERMRMRSIVADLPDDTLARLDIGSPTAGDCLVAATALRAAQHLLDAG